MAKLANNRTCICSYECMYIHKHHSKLITNIISSPISSLHTCQQVDLSTIKRKYYTYTITAGP